MTALTALLILIVVMVIGVPIPLSFLASAAYICFVNGTDHLMLFTYGFRVQNTILLLTIPLFVMAGAVIDKGGIGEKLIEGLERFSKGSKVALGTVTIVACAIFGAVSGSASATTSCIGSIMTPRLKENGYTAGHIGALLASSGVLGIMIPPSILMILYAWGTGTSVLACFLATIIPGIILIILFSLVNAWLVKHEGPESPEARAALEQMLIDAQKKEAEKKLVKAEHEKRKGGTSAIPAVLMPIFLLGGIYGGVFTTTEGAAFSVLYSLVIGIFYYRKIDFPTFRKTLSQSGETAGTIMVMLFMVSILSRLYIQRKDSQQTGKGGNSSPARPHIRWDNSQGLCMLEDQLPVTAPVVCPQPPFQHDVVLLIVLAPSLIPNHIRIFARIVSGDADPADRPIPVFIVLSQFSYQAPDLLCLEIHGIGRLHRRFPQRNRLGVSIRILIAGFLFH